jgi:hypothetical protein
LKQHIQIAFTKKLKAESACYSSLQNFASSRRLSKNLKIEIYKSIILPIVLYGYDTWPLTQREEHRLTMCENRVQRRIFGPKRGGGEWQEAGGLRYKDLHNLYASSSIIREIKSGI